MTPNEIAAHADAWIAYQKAPRDSPSRLELHSAADLYDLIYEDPESLWAVILDIHHKGQSIEVQQSLAAGPIEDILSQHGDQFIDRVENEARRDPTFAKLLGGIWKDSMSDEIWNRLQAVWDRRGWDGIPE